MSNERSPADCLVLRLAPKAVPHAGGIHRTGTVAVTARRGLCFCVRLGFAGRPGIVRWDSTVRLREDEEEDRDGDSAYGTPIHKYSGAASLCPEVPERASL